MNSINDLGRKAKKASKKIAVAGEEKNKALKAIAEALINKANDIVSANKIDIKNANITDFMSFGLLRLSPSVWYLWVWGFIMSSSTLWSMCPKYKLSINTNIKIVFNTLILRKLAKIITVIRIESVIPITFITNLDTSEFICGFGLVLSWYLAFPSSL